MDQNGRRRDPPIASVLANSFDELPSPWHRSCEAACFRVTWQVCSSDRIETHVPPTMVPNEHREMFDELSRLVLLFHVLRLWCLHCAPAIVFRDVLFRQRKLACMYLRCHARSREGQWYTRMIHRKLCPVPPSSCDCTGLAISPLSFLSLPILQPMAPNLLFCQ